MPYLTYGSKGQSSVSLEITLDNDACPMQNSAANSCLRLVKPLGTRGWETAIMSQDDQNQTDLMHVHICIHCGHPRPREQVENREVRSGILHCPRCGLDGPLNVEIRDSLSA